MEIWWLFCVKLDHAALIPSCLGLVNQPHGTCPSKLGKSKYITETAVMSCLTIASVDQKECTFQEIELCRPYETCKPRPLNYTLPYLLHCFTSTWTILLWPSLLIWIIFKPDMEKLSRAQWNKRWDYLSIPKHQRLGRWIFWCGYIISPHTSLCMWLLIKTGSIVNSR